MWFHFWGGIILFLDNNIATVEPNLFYNVGSWSQSLCGIIPLFDKNMANVTLNAGSHNNLFSNNYNGSSISYSVQNYNIYVLISGL